jgi:hypothetical protein
MEERRGAWEDEPVDGGDDWVESEAGWVAVVLVPDGPAVVFPVVRRLEGIVNGDDDREQPACKSEDLVPDDRGRAV